ncbi:MAG: hypothetical protein KAT68_05445 [Bacteroidales bacterium]|nr:hypothetical protein [Bacteroidales bacterium]
MRTRLLIVVFASFVFFGCSSKMNNGEELIKKIHDTYNGKWFKKIAFEQNSYFYKNDSIYKKQIWYEMYQFPGKLAIKYDSISSSDGLLFANDTLSIFQAGEIISQKRKIHDLVVLSMDICSQDVNKTISQLNELGYDLTKIHNDIWNGKEVYVVGAEKGDTMSRQFWIEKERLIFVRMLSIENEQYKEIIFDNYTKFNDSWIEQTVIFKLNGKMTMKEEYFNIREPNSINQKNFNPKNFKNLEW